MPELEDRVQERRSPRNKILVAAVLAGLALAACQTGSWPSVEASSQTLAPTTSETRVTTTSAPAVSTPERTTRISATSTTVPSTKTPEIRPGLAGCLPFVDVKKYQNHEYEVCTAYITNAEEVALQGMYKFGNNSISYLADGARHHFETRYWLQPRTAVEKEVDSWPKTRKITGNKVAQTIILRELSSSIAEDRAVIKTEESWRVMAPDGTVLLDEPLQDREATMCRGKLPGHPLHEWVVVSDRADPGFDCIGFDKANGLQP